MSPNRRDFFAILAGGAASLAARPAVANVDDIPVLRARLIQLRDDAMAHYERCFEEDEWSSDTFDAIGFVGVLDTAIMASCPHSHDIYRDSEWHQDVIECPLCNADASPSFFDHDWRNVQGRITYEIRM